MALNVVTEATDHRESFDPRDALRNAWVWFLTLGAAPLVLLVLMTWAWMRDALPRLDHNQSFNAFVATMIWVAISGAAGFLFQEYFFKSYYKGLPVTAKDYIHGKVAGWSMMISGAFVAVLCCWMSQALMPHMFALLIVYVFYLTQYPHGRAMVANHGDKDRAQLYSEPK